MNKDTEKILLGKASEVLENVYAPYSGISVAAAVLADSGKIYTGVNVENSSYGLTICAERNAIYQAVTNGDKQFSAMAIVSDSQNINSPCGACRQVLMEFSPKMDIVVQSPAGVFYYKAEELLPGAFSLKEI